MGMRKLKPGTIFLTHVIHSCIAASTLTYFMTTGTAQAFNILSNLEDDGKYVFRLAPEPGENLPLGQVFVPVGSQLQIFGLSGVTSASTSLFGNTSFTPTTATWEATTSFALSTYLGIFDVQTAVPPQINGTWSFLGQTGRVQPLLTVAVPEPATLNVPTTGLILLGGWLVRRKNRKV